MGGPLHSLVVCAEELHELEREFLELHRAGDQVAAVEELKNRGYL